MCSLRFGRQEMRSQEVNDDGANEVIFHRVFIINLNLQPVVAFNHVEAVFLVPTGGFTTTFVCFAAPRCTGVDT
jgi:hypothetical protein